MTTTVPSKPNILPTATAPRMPSSEKWKIRFPTSRRNPFSALMVATPPGSSRTATRQPRSPVRIRCAVAAGSVATVRVADSGSRPRLRGVGTTSARSVRVKSQVRGIRQPISDANSAR